MRLLLLFVSLIANAEAVSETEVVFYYASSQVETYAPLTQEKLKKNPRIFVFAMFNHYFLAY